MVKLDIGFLMGNDSKYVLYKKVARGGMAEIYLGKHVGEDGFQRICCIKRILPHLADQSEFIKMFRDEAHICKRLQHANIVRVEGFEEVEGSYAIIMEFINGGDLRSLLSSCEKQKKQLTVPMALYIVAEAARGLHFAHTKIDDLTGKPMGIVHRDISPQNILISFEGEIKVGDFGIADAENKLTETKPGVVKGKYSYMSPEQITSEIVDARTDIFALTIVLWEMLAMKRLFQGETEFKTIEMVRSCKIEKDLRLLNPSVDKDLYNLIQKGLSKKPNNRFKSAGDFERNIRKFLNTNYSDFTVNDLSDFIKKIFKNRAAQMQVEIKSLLSKQNKISNSRNFLQSQPKQVQISDNLKLPSSFQPIVNVNSKNTNYSRQKNQTTRRKEIKSKTKSKSKSQLSRSVHAKRIKNKKGFFRRLYDSFIKLFLFFTIIVIGYFGNKYKYLFIPKNVSLAIKTTPDRVKIKINNTVLSKGYFVQTPISIKAKDTKQSKNSILIYTYGIKNPIELTLLDENKIIFTRNGFKKEVIDFNSQTNTKLHLILEETSNFAPTKAQLKSSRIKKVWISVNKGEEIDILELGKFVDFKYLIYGTQQELRVYPNGIVNKKGSFKCIFTPKSKSWKYPLIVNIHPESKRCRY